MKTTPDLSYLAQPGRCLDVRVTPRAGRNAVLAPENGVGEIALRVQVTAPPEDGKANRAVRKLLAGALGVAPSRLTLLRGAAGRDKRFRLD